MEVFCKTPLIFDERARYIFWIAVGLAAFVEDGRRSLSPAQRGMNEVNGDRRAEQSNGSDCLCWCGQSESYARPNLLNFQPQIWRKKPAFFIVIDWANTKHDVYVIDSQGSSYHGEIEHSTNPIDGFVSDLLSRANSRPLSITLEQFKGSLLHALTLR